MTNQELFDTVARALMAQGGPSFQEDNCVYRNPANGRKCAAGHLIPDEKYASWMEGKSVLAVELILAIGIPQIDADAWRLVLWLQHAHDQSCHVTTNDSDWFTVWRKRMHTIAADNGLSDAALGA